MKKYIKPSAEIMGQDLFFGKMEILCGSLASAATESFTEQEVFVDIN